MAEREQHVLLYGSFGRGVYDFDDKQWKFERSTLDACPLKRVEALGEAILLDEGPPSHKTKAAPSTRRSKQKKALVDAYPELVPASSALSEFTRISEATLVTLNRHDPNKGSLLAYIEVRGEQSRRATVLLAHVTGSTGSDMRLVQVPTQRQGWGDSKSVWLDMPLLVGEEMCWRGPGAPIQAITVAAPIADGEHYIAVRLLTKTAIFEPSLGRARSRTGASVNDNHLFDLSISDTGSSPHSDVAFDPWNTRRFAIVDQMSRWSIWIVSARGISSAECLSRGALQANRTETTANVLQDGWARISWVCDSLIFAVCNRRYVSIFDVSDQYVAHPFDVGVNLDKITGWILDMLRLPAFHQYLCILTSTRLLVFEVVRAADNGPVVTLVINICHYRNAEDISLRLHTFQDDNGVVILIRSELDSTVMCYRCNLSSEFPIVDDPFEISVLIGGIGPTKRQNILDLHFSPLTLRRLDGIDGPEALEAELHDDRIAFYSATILKQDYGIHQDLYASGPNMNALRRIGPPRWRQHMRKRVYHSGLDEDFIDDDGIGNGRHHVDLLEPRSSMLTRRTAQADQFAPDTWTVSYARIVNRLNKGDVSQIKDLDDVMEEASHVLRIGQSTSIRTLRDLCEDEIATAGFHCAADCLEGLQESIQFSRMKGQSRQDDQMADKTPGLCLRSLGFPQVMQILPSSEGGPFAAFHDLVRQHLTPDYAIARTDSAEPTRSEFALHMAAELTLASYVLRSIVTEDEPRVEDEETQEWGSFRRIASVSNGLRQISLNDSSQLQASALPTPSASGTRSTTTGSSYTTHSLPAEVIRLSHYTSFSSGAIPPALPRKLDNVLAHWTLSADPSTYDWRSVKRDILQRQDQQLDNEEMTERERDRLRRKAERALRRQRREAEESALQQIRSSQAPEIFSASQPASRSQTPFLSQPSFSHPGGSSQPTGFSQMPASQVLSGRHGGRPARKKRRSGF